MSLPFTVNRRRRCALHMLQQKYISCLRPLLVVASGQCTPDTIHHAHQSLSRHTYTFYTICHHGVVHLLSIYYSRLAIRLFSRRATIGQRACCSIYTTSVLSLSFYVKNTTARTNQDSRMKRRVTKKHPSLVAFKNLPKTRGTSSRLQLVLFLSIP